MSEIVYHEDGSVEMVAPEVVGIEPAGFSDSENLAEEMVELKSTIAQLNENIAALLALLLAK